jgi:hypothetical protein
MLWCYLQGYAQESVDRSGEVAVDKPGVAGLADWARDPPGLGFGGGGCGGAKHLQKKFLKKF